MSASMAEGIAEVLAEHKFDRVKAVCSCSDEVQVGLKGDPQTHEEHVAEVLAANGYGKLDATKFVLAEREAELLNLKGPCRAPKCVLHFAHRGPCDTRRPE